jgi:HNH endonuclease
MSGVAAGAAIGDPARCRYGVGRGSAPVERFYQKVRVDGASGCHLWLGARTAFGHGRLSRGGAWCSAHRFAWELEHGPVAEGLYVLHRCTTPGCVNTRHLFVGTARDGTLLNHSRGRYLSLLPPQAQITFCLSQTMRDALLRVARDQEQTISSLLRKIVFDALQPESMNGLF